MCEGRRRRGQNRIALESTEEKVKIGEDRRREHRKQEDRVRWERRDSRRKYLEAELREEDGEGDDR